jgi:hypothetical protein
MNFLDIHVYLMCYNVGSKWIYLIDILTITASHEHQTHYIDFL